MCPVTVIIIRLCPSVDKIPEGKNPVFGQNKIRHRGNSRIQKGDGKPFAGGFCGKDALHQRHGKHLLSLSKYVKKHFSAQPCISLFEKEKRGKRCGRTETDGNAFGIDGRGRAGCGKNGRGSGSGPRMRAGVDILAKGQSSAGGLPLRMTGQRGRIPARRARSLVRGRLPGPHAYFPARSLCARSVSRPPCSPAARWPAWRPG